MFLFEIRLRFFSDFLGFPSDFLVISCDFPALFFHVEWDSSVTVTPFSLPVQVTTKRTYDFANAGGAEDFIAALQYLILDHNRLVGQIPAEIGNLGQLFAL